MFFSWVTLSDKEMKLKQRIANKTKQAIYYHYNKFEVQFFKILTQYQLLI